MYAIIIHWWFIKLVSGNRLVPSGNNALPKLLLKGSMMWCDNSKAQWVKPTELWNILPMPYPILSHLNHNWFSIRCTSLPCRQLLHNKSTNQWPHTRGTWGRPQRALHHEGSAGNYPACCNTEKSFNDTPQVLFFWKLIHPKHPLQCSNLFTILYKVLSCSDKKNQNNQTILGKYHW